MWPILLPPLCLCSLHSDKPSESAERLLQERFRKLGLFPEAFSSIQYRGTRTYNPPTDFSGLLRSLEQQLDNNNTRSPRSASVIFKALQVLVLVLITAPAHLRHCASCKTNPFLLVRPWVSVSVGRSQMNEWPVTPFSQMSISPAPASASAVGMYVFTRSLMTKKTYTCNLLLMTPPHVGGHCQASDQLVRSKLP